MHLASSLPRSFPPLASVSPRYSQVPRHTVYRRFLHRLPWVHGRHEMRDAIPEHLQCTLVSLVFVAHFGTIEWTRQQCRTD